MRDPTTKDEIMNDKIMLAKAVTKFVASKSVGMVVANVVKNHVTTANKIEEIQVIVGAYVLAGMVADRALAWTDGKFDETIEAVQKFKSMKETSNQ